MRIHLRNSRQKGAALAFALMTALLLMTLSTTVVGLSMRHSRVGAEADYSQEALHAADWYLNAALDYLKNGSDNNKDALNYDNGGYGFKNPYAGSTTMNVVDFDPNKADKNTPVLGIEGVSASVSKLDSQQSKEYGLNGSSGGYLLRFHPTYGPLVYFPSSSGTEGRFAVSDIAIEKIGATNGRPGYYHLAIYVRVYSESSRTAVESYMNSTSNRSAAGYPTEGLLATRVIDVKARTESPLDYLHIIQNAQSWRAQGLNLDGYNGSLLNKYIDGNEQALKNGLAICGFPDQYEERGKIRIDGGTRMSTDRRIQGTNKDRIDGTARLFGDALFEKELTQQKGIEAIGMDTKKVGTTFQGGFRGKQDPIGLPLSGENSNFDESGNFIRKDYNTRSTYQTFARDKATESGASGHSLNYSIGINKNSSNKSTNSTNGVLVGPPPSQSSIRKASDVPDVYSANNAGSDPTRVDTRPSFAKIVVTLDGDRVKVQKVNEGAGVSYTYGTYAAKDIKNGIITVQGGNVEVKSTKGKEFTGSLTIVSDVEASRENSLNYKGTQSNSYNYGSIYSDFAREFIDGGGANHLPPFKISELKQWTKEVNADRAKQGLAPLDYSSDLSISRAGANDYVWPTPTSEAVEREGNVYVTSDIKCGDNKDTGVRGSIGIVAKNYIAFNDKGISAANPKKGLDIEATLFSFDKAVQFDWNNDARNPNFNILKSGAKEREFKFTGTIVSSEIDVEGSEEGIGYLKQVEQSNTNVDIENAPPYIPAYSEGITRWIITSYTDRSSRNWI